MSLPTDHTQADGPIEARLRHAADGFPGTAAGADGLGAVVTRGRRSLTVARAVQLGVATSLVASAAVAAPGLFDRGPVTPTVLSHDDEVVAVDEAPAIEVLSPRDGAVVTGPAVTFSGVVEIGAEVRVGPDDVPVAADGRWSVVLDLDEGQHTLRFWAVDAAGNRDSAQVTVTVTTSTPEVEQEPETEVLDGAEEEPSPEPKAPEPEPEVVPVKQETPAPAKSEPAKESEPAKPAAPSVAFTAHNTYGECAEPVPYDEFWGTAEPGSRVWVFSEYGEKEITVGGDGEWFARVEFPTAPQGLEFPVKVKSLLTGEKKFFTFTNTGSGGTHQEVAFTAVQENDHVEHDPPYGYWSGTAAPGTKVSVSSDHGSAQTEAGADGKWRTKVWFETAPYGTNTWSVVVESSAGDRKVFEYTGTRPEPAPEPSKTEEPAAPQPAEVAFTSDQVHDVTDDEVPHSLYAGTVTPGDKVWVTSEHGEGWTYADDNGNWSLWVEFPTAPRGTTITVWVKHWQTGETHTYELQVV